MYETAWLSLPADKKTQLLGLLSSDKSDIVVIATPPGTQAQLNTALTEAAGGVAISATKSPQLPLGTTSTVEASSYAPHRALLPGLLKAHDDNTQGFTGVTGGGVIVAKASTGEITAVQWTVDSGKRVVTLLGYWRPSVVVYIKPTQAGSVQDEPQRQQALPLLTAANPGIVLSALPLGDAPEVNSLVRLADRLSNVATVITACFGIFHTFSSSACAITLHKLLTTAGK